MIRTLVAAIALALAQTPAPPRADGPPAGTGRLAGVVVADDATGRPIGRVLVTLNGGDIRLRPATLTNGDGQFAFANLPAGRFTIMVSKPGYVTNYYGAKRPRVEAMAQAVVLNEGQTVAGLQVRLPPGAVVTGTVRDQYGRPMPEQSILLRPGRRAGSGWTMGNEFEMSGRTDDRGVFRAFGLPSATYFLSVSYSGFRTAQRLTTAEEMFYLEHPGSPAPIDSVASFASTYYPGTVEPKEALPITLAAGEERSGTDIVMKLVPVTRLDVQVFAPDGQPYTQALSRVNTVQSIILTDAGAAITLGMIWSSRIDPDGRASFPGLPPGRYVMTGRMTPASSADGGQPPPWWADQEILIDGRSSASVPVMLQTGVKVAGQVIYDGAATLPGSLRISLVDTRDIPSSVPPATVANDRSFSFPSVAPGTYRLEVSGSGIPATWVVRSGMFKDRDIVDMPLEVHANEDVTGLVVTLTDKKTEMAGTLVDAANRPATEYSVMVFSTDRALWRPGSSVVRAPVRADSTGQFIVSGLPPGEYFLCAIVDFEPDAWLDATWLEERIPASFKFTLGDGEHKRQTLKLTGG